MSTTFENRLRRREDDVVAKIMDGEAVIINLATGVYYSMDGIGTTVWSRIEDGLSLRAIVAEVASRYDVTTERAGEDVLRLANELIAEDLVAIGDPDESAGEVAAPPPGSARLPYVPPRLTPYRDMEDLLALDPPTPGLADLRWKE